MRCPCGSSQTIWTQSHEQCAACGRVLASCCEGGETCRETPEPPDRIADDKTATGQERLA